MNKVRKTLYGWAVVLAAFSAVVVGCKDDDKPEPNPCALQATAAAEKNTITVTATGGTTPYQYKLNNGDFGSSNAFSGLAAGDYTVTMKDAKNCTATTNTITISACDATTLALEAKGEAYTITATATGGEGSYQYAIDGTTFGSDNTFNVNEAKAYTVTVKDAKGCTQTAEVSAAAIETFTDPRDEQTYKVVKIGDQVWMAENLNYATTEGSSCYDRDPANCTEYGKLYTWSEAMKVAPTGWHLPEKKEWDVLINRYGGPSTAGKDLNAGGSSGFEAKFGGAIIAGSYKGKGQYSDFWTSTVAEADPTNKAYVIESNSSTDLFSGHGTSKTNASSVRLLKN